MLFRSFNFSGNTIIPGDALEQIAAATRQPIRKSGPDNNLWIWEEPEPGKRYMIAADVARGDAADNSAFHIFNVDSMEQVAEYQGKIAPEQYADLLFQTAKEYGNCLMIVENNSFGYGVLEKLKSMKHPTIYHHRKGSYDFIEPVQASYDPNAVPGFSTNVKMRDRKSTRLNSSHT